jgi:hypothetical protein
MARLCLTPLRYQSCVADIEQLVVVWHDIHQLVAASEGSSAGASLGGLSAILTPSTLNRFAPLLSWALLSCPTHTRISSAAKTPCRLPLAVLLAVPLAAPLVLHQMQLVFPLQRRLRHLELQNLPQMLLLPPLKPPPSKSKALRAPFTRESHVISNHFFRVTRRQLPLSLPRNCHETVLRWWQCRRNWEHHQRGLFQGRLGPGFIFLFSDTRHQPVHSATTATTACVNVSVTRTHRGVEVMRAAAAAARTPRESALLYTSIAVILAG